MAKIFLRTRNVGVPQVSCSTASGSPKAILRTVLFCISMCDGRGAVLVDQRAGREPVGGEGAREVALAGRDHVRVRPPRAGRRLEPAGAPATVQEETLDAAPAHD